jgi:TonB family protein
MVAPGTTGETKQVYRFVISPLPNGDMPMTNFQASLSAATLLFLVAASTVQATAQTAPDSNAACTIRKANARAITHYPADRPSTLPSINTYNPTGTAIVRIDLTEHGTPQNPTIVKSTGAYILDEAAKKLVLSQRFAPAIRDCVAVSGSYLYEVDYNYDY